MKQSLFRFLSVAGSILILIAVIGVSSYLGSTKKFDIGPHQFFNWHGRSIITIGGGPIILESDQYFEVWRGLDREQSIYRPPELGQSAGKYMLETWGLAEPMTIKGNAKIYSNVPNQLTESHPPIDQFGFGFISACVGLIAWILLIKITSEH